MFVTHHAAAQYVHRIRPDMSRECARAHLIREVVRAESTGQRTELGHPIWSLCSRPRCRTPGARPWRRRRTRSSPRRGGRVPGCPQGTTSTGGRTGCGSARASGGGGAGGDELGPRRVRGGHRLARGRRCGVLVGNAATVTWTPEARAAWISGMRERGLCDCGSPARQERTTCAECAAVRSQKQKDRRVTYAVASLCETGCKRFSGTFSRCPECRRKQAERDARGYKTRKAPEPSK